MIFFHKSFWEWQFHSFLWIFSKLQTLLLFFAFKIIEEYYLPYLVSLYFIFLILRFVACLFCVDFPKYSVHISIMCFEIVYQGFRIVLVEFLWLMCLVVSNDVYFCVILIFISTLRSFWFSFVHFLVGGFKYIYIYIYRERERESGRQTEIKSHINIGV